MPAPQWNVHNNAASPGWGHSPSTRKWRFIHAKPLDLAKYKSAWSTKVTKRRT
ncbi:hypothetical protein [Hydrogenophaga soli]